MHFRFNRWTLAFCTLAAFTTHSTYADSPKQLYVGVLGGVASPTVNGTDYLHDRFTYGANVGYRFNEYFSSGVYLTYSQKHENDTGTNHIFLLAGFEGDFYSSWIKGLHAGLKVGMIRGKIYIPTVGAAGQLIAAREATEFSFGPKIGYDYTFADRVSLGVELNSMFATDNKYAIFNYLGVVKYYFDL